MRMASSGWSRAVLVAMVCLLASPALGAERGKDARRVYDEATSAFGLGRYAEAAEKYEQAFSMRPDPALLYNAAQSYRLAGNKPRALELYRNCLRLYPDFPNAEDARNHVASLKKQIDDEQHAPPAPATMPAPVAAGPPVSPVPVAPSPAPAMPPPVLTQPPPAPAPAASPAPLLADASLSAKGSGGDQDRSITQNTWFWVAVGAAAVAVGAVVVVLATRGTTYPDATFGKATGN